MTMPISINTALIGKEYPPYPFTVERGKIKEFARAIGDLNPCYLDDRVGAASEWGDLIAPPTFAVTFRDETADTGAMLRDLGTDVSRILHGEQEFELFRPLQPGQTYLCRARIVDIYEKSGRSGPMAFVVRETTITDRTNDVVAAMRHITIVRL
ncbi:MAG: MaoC family dehydratase [Candidatus Rokuibacteriota bacterium]|nr:MAG: MaoC family dehydratase [Candidatus Rokubacteria bacterium]